MGIIWPTGEHYGRHIEYIMNFYMAKWLSAGSSENGELIELPYLVSVLCNAKQL